MTKELLDELRVCRWASMALKRNQNVTAEQGFFVCLSSFSLLKTEMGSGVPSLGSLSHH